MRKRTGYTLTKWCTIALYRSIEYMMKHKRKNIRRQTITLLCKIDKKIEEGGGVFVGSIRGMAEEKWASYAVAQRMIKILEETRCLSIERGGMAKRSKFRKIITDAISAGVEEEKLENFSRVIKCLSDPENTSSSDRYLLTIAYYIAQERSFTRKEMLTETGVARQTLAKYLSSLEQCEFLKKDKKRKPYLYEVITQGQAQA